ncbi:MAG: hypothetical protein AAF933_11070, partial [Pseudomonadota bacterium]
ADVAQALQPLIDVEKSWRSRQLGLPPLLHSNESWPQRSGEVDRGAQLLKSLKVHGNPNARARLVTR